jgi:hypothetical protein
MTFGHPFRKSDLCDPLAEPIRELPEEGGDWEETAADMLAPITSLTDPVTPRPIAPSGATIATRYRCGKRIGVLVQRLSMSSPTATANGGSAQ